MQVLRLFFGTKVTEVQAGVITPVEFLDHFEGIKVRGYLTRGLNFADFFCFIVA